MKDKILKVLQESVEKSLAIEQNVILEWDFEDVAEKLSKLYTEKVDIAKHYYLKGAKVADETSETQHFVKDFECFFELTYRENEI